MSPMPGSAHEESTWTVETLRQNTTDQINALDRRILDRFDGLQVFMTADRAAQKESVKLALDAVDRAMQKADAANEKRFDSVNEFRATLAEQQRSLMPRLEVEVLFKAQDERIKSLADLMVGKIGQTTGMKDAWGWIGLVLGVMIAASRFIQ